MDPDDPTRGLDDAGSDRGSEPRDAVLLRAVEHAARDVQRHPIRASFLEALLEEALARIWPSHAPGGHIKARVQLRVPGWDPQPGPTDLVLAIAGERQPTAIAEIKVLDVDQTLWDLIKVISLVGGESPFLRGYLIVATTPKRWRDAEVAALYAPPDATAPDGKRQWTTEDLVRRWARSWKYLLEGGRARPRDVPAVLRTTFLAAHPVPTFPEYELRAIAVEPLGERGRLQFGDDGWPSPQSGADERWGLRDLVEAHLDANRYREAHPDLRAHHQGRAEALSLAFGRVRVDAPPPGSDGLAGLLADTLTRIARLTSPFDRYLEAPPSVAALHERHGARLNDATRELRDRLTDLAADLVAALWQLDRDATVSPAELVKHGFDPAAPEPDPIDYW